MGLNVLNAYPLPLLSCGTKDIQKLSIYLTNKEKGSANEAEYKL